MTPEQALTMLDQASSMVALDRNNHMKIQQAVQVLKDLISKKKEEKSK